MVRIAPHSTRLPRGRQRQSLLALWGFVDDTTFLTKAGHVGVVYRLPGIDYEGLPPEELRLARASLRGRPSPARRALPRLSVPAQAARRSRSRRLPAAQPVAREAIQRRADYLNGRARRAVRARAVPRAALRAAVATRPPARSCSGLWTQPREALRDWLGTTDTLCAPRVGARPRHRHAAPQGAGARGAARRVRASSGLRRTTPSGSSVGW